MELSIKVVLDSSHQIDCDFLKWYTECQKTHQENKIKDAILTGYFITNQGIHEYYKLKFEKELQDICEKDLLNKITQIEIEKKDIINKHKEDLSLYEAKINNIKKINDELVNTIDSLNARFKTEKDATIKELESYYETKKQKEISLLEIEKNTICNNLEYQIINLKNEILTLKQTQQERQNDIINTITQKHEAEKQSLCDKNIMIEQQLHYFKSLSEQKDNQLQDAFKSETKDKILQLEKTIQQKETEIVTLKTCNFVKGATGENAIINMLREYYPKHTIHHTGKTAHEGDIQVIDNTDNSLIVIESKYKQNIDRNDVEKFCRDVSIVCQKEGTINCVGGLFVSLLTRNIPTKGDAYFEMIGNVPVMYVGFSNLDEFNIYFKKYFDMFNEVCKFYQQQGIQKSSVDEVLEEMNFYFNLLIKNKTRIEDFKNNCLSKINKFITDIETDNKVILARLEDVLRRNNNLKYKNLNTCERCGEIFSNKRLLTKHVKTCGETI